MSNPSQSLAVPSVPDERGSDDEYFEEDLDAFGTPPVASWQQTRSFRQALDIGRYQIASCIAVVKRHLIAYLHVSQAPAREAREDLP